MSLRIRIASILTAALVTTGSASCGSARRSDPLGHAFVPATPVVAQGERLFMEHCHSCHPGGAAGLGPALNDKPLPAFMIRAQVRAGVGAMPAFPPEDLPAADLDAVVAYLAARRAS